MEESAKVYFEAENEKRSQAFHPWRRFFARTLDLSVYSLPWSVLLVTVFHINLLARSNLGNILDSFVILLIMLFVEPLLLHLFGTTPGKAIFGLRIETDEGRRLSYGEGLERTWGVLSKGYGYNIPIYNIVRAWKSYKICSNHETQPWDEFTFYTIKDTKRVCAVMYIVAAVATIFVTIIIAFSQFFPSNRGELTISQFVENYNYYAKYYGIEFGNEYLNENGEWVEKIDDGTFWIDSGLGHVDAPPEFHFTVKDGYVQSISFGVEEKNTDMILLSAYETHMQITALAFVCAQNNVGLFSNLPNSIIDHIDGNSAQSASFTEAGITIAWETELVGFPAELSNILFSDDSTPENFFALHFSLTK